MSNPNVLGLDLSITATGYADGYGYGTIATKATDGDRRLNAIAAMIEDLLTTDTDSPGGPRIDRIGLVVIEGPVLRSQAAIGLAMLHGVIRSRLMDWGIPYALVPPATLKKYATGRGNATKTDMALALYKRVQRELADDNQVDAFWLRAMGMDHLGAPPVILPAANRAAMDKVRWPS